MSLILSLESSTSICSVALHDAGNLLTTGEVHVNQMQASTLAVLIDQVVKNAGIDMKQVKAIAITSGPGSYTGLRIGTSTAKGLCYALDIPLISVDTLSVMAVQLTPFNFEDALLCPMIDARRMEVYCTVFDEKMNVVQKTEARIIDENSFSLLKAQPIWFFGDGAAKCEPVIKNVNTRFIKNVIPRASFLGVLAAEKWERHETEDLTTFEPHYLKEFQVKKSANV